MNGLDKILTQITLDCELQCTDILNQADEQCKEIREGYKKTADKKAEDKIRQAKEKASNQLKISRSNANFEGKKNLLNAKKNMVDNVVKQAYDKLMKLDEKEYFEFLSSMIKKFARPYQGEVILNAVDRGRLPNDFYKAFDEKNLKISEKIADIDGGCILKYGDIEQNCSFESLFLDNQEQIFDAVYSVLFS